MQAGTPRDDNCRLRAVTQTMHRDAGTRLPFLIAVALIAAALGDPLVETVSNSGLIARGYADNDHLSVIPTLLAGAVLALLLICRHCLQLLRGPGRHKDRLVETAALVCARSPLQDLPYVLVLQFAALYAMESTEQLLSGGTLLGGGVWLGGPVWFSVPAHAALGMVCTILLARAMRSIVKRCATLVRLHCNTCPMLSLMKTVRFWPVIMPSRPHFAVALFTFTS